LDRNTLIEKGRILLSPLVKILSKVPPNILTFAGFLIVLISSIIISIGKYRIGGIILILGTILDAVDGQIARNTGKTTKFGAFIDSTLDRYGDFFIFISIAVAGRESIIAPLSIFILLGAYITSYTRARADSLGIEIKEGHFTRFERILIIIIGLIIGERFIIYFLIILALGTNITAIHRIVLAYKRMKDGGN
jgi:phosphatidylglycerophosphate synthase